MICRHFQVSDVEVVLTVRGRELRRSLGICNCQHVPQTFASETVYWSPGCVIHSTQERFDERFATCATCQHREPARRTRGMPGTELTKLLEQLGVRDRKSCGCKALARQMDGWGVRGCQRRTSEIVEQIRRHMKAWKWQDVLTDTTTAAFQSLRLGVTWRINPLDPIPGLVREAIRRAAECDTRED